MPTKNDTKNELQRTTLIMDPELWKRLHHLAIERRTTLTAVVDEALRQYLARNEKGRKQR